MYFYWFLSIELEIGRSVQEWGKWHGIININDVTIKSHNKSWVPAFGCQMTFSNYYINVDDPMSFTSLLHGAPQLWYSFIAEYYEKYYFEDPLMLGNSI